MNAIPDRRSGDGRRRNDRRADALRALVHDIGHEIMAINILIRTALSEDPPSPLARQYLELARRQTETLISLIRRAMGPAREEPIAVRSLLAQLVAQANVIDSARVHLVDGPAGTAEIDGGALWRILSNILDNAVRAAGPDGTVSVAISGTEPTVVEIADDGPGFGAAAPGWASLGLTTVTNLTQAIGAEVTFTRREPAGTLARLILPGPVGRQRNGSSMKEGS